MGSRKKTNARKHSFLQGISKLFANDPRLSALGRRYLDQEEDEDLYAEFDDPAADDPVDDWVDRLNRLLGHHTTQDQVRARGLRGEVQISGLTRDGEIQAVAMPPSGRFDVFLDLGLTSGGLGGGCSCVRSGGNSPCEHTFWVASQVLRQLHNRDARIAQDILAGTLPNVLPEVRHDQTDLMLEELDDFIASRPLPVSDEVDDEPTSVASRLVWKVSTHSSLSITPYVQRRKKRGNGWTKGQKLSLERLRESDEFIQTDVDAMAVKAIRQESAHAYYYRPTWTLNLISLLEAVAGHDNVILGESPVIVQRGTFVIRAIENGDEFRLEFGIDAQEDINAWKIYTTSDGVIACEEDLGKVAFCRCDAGELRLARWLLESRVSIPRNRLDDLRQRLERLAAFTAVELPPALAGPIVEEETQLVALLRTRQTGSLECGLRVRDARGELHRPGEGVLLYCDTQDGKQVQFRRNADDEFARANKLIFPLGLAQARRVADWSWRFLNFDHALGFLEVVDTQAEELGVCPEWDVNSSSSLQVLGTVTAKNVRVEVAKKRDWFGLNGGCRIGDHEFQLSDLLNAVRSEPVEGYMEVQPGQWAKISAELREKLKQLRDVAHRNRKSIEIDATAAPIVQDLLEEQIDFEAPRSWKTCVARLDKAMKLEPEVPKSFRGELREYQLEGYRWLRRLAEWGVGGCLADDMGLGKTIQALALLIDRQETGPALVIAPTSVGFNWIRETERFAPELKVHSYRDTSRAEFLGDIGNGDVVVCSYGLALRDAEAIAQVKWGTMVLDEAQFIKNSRSKTSQAIRTFDADWKVALTGTPMENHLGELWSLFRTVSPGLFGSWDQFRDRFASPIEKDNDDERRLALSRVIRPFVLRRTKEAVLTELPARTESNLYVDLTDVERSRYDEMRLAAVGELTDVAGAPDTKDQRFRVLAMLTRLRQLSCHVGLVDETWEGQSAKISLLVETLQSLREEGHRALVFSQFTSYLALIRKALEDAGITYEYLDGSTPANERQARVDKFQQGETDAFLISLKAGGTGLNLTAASYVIHMDPWWNPAVEDQATDRAHRYGQEKPVMVYRIVARGTIEEKILDLHGDKRDLVSGVMDGTQAAGKLSTDELIDLIRAH